eukprot:6181717-Pleurochrysis_carterae.AAC.5
MPASLGAVSKHKLLKHARLIAPERPPSSKPAPFKESLSRAAEHAAGARCEAAALISHLQRSLFRVCKAACVLFRVCARRSKPRWPRCLTTTRRQSCERERHGKGFLPASCALLCRSQHAPRLDRARLAAGLYGEAVADAAL